MRKPQMPDGVGYRELVVVDMISKSRNAEREEFTLCHVSGRQCLSAGQWPRLCHTDSKSWGSSHDAVLCGEGIMTVGGDGVSQGNLAPRGDEMAPCLMRIPSNR